MHRQEKKPLLFGDEVKLKRKKKLEKYGVPPASSLEYSGIEQPSHSPISHPSVRG